MHNQITLIGNLGKDPEVKHFEGGSVCAQFGVATNHSYKNKKGEWETITTWHNVSLWGHLAEKAEKTFRKGNQVFIQGRMSYRDYETKEGVKKTHAEVLGDTARLLGQSGGTSQAAAPQETQSTDEGGSYDDLPF